MFKNPKPALYTVALCTHSDRDSDHDSYSEPLEWSLSRIASRASKIPYTGAATESISRWCRPASVPQPAREWGSGPGPPCPTARAGGGSASPWDPDPGRGPARRQGLQVAESLRLACSTRESLQGLLLLPGTWVSGAGVTRALALSPSVKRQVFCVRERVKVVKRAQPDGRAGSA